MTIGTAWAALLIAGLAGCGGSDGGGGGGTVDQPPQAAQDPNDCVTITPEPGVTMRMADYNRLNDGEWAALVKESSGGKAGGYSSFAEFVKAKHPELASYQAPAFCDELFKK